MSPCQKERKTVNLYNRHAIEAFRETHKAVESLAGEELTEGQLLWFLAAYYQADATVSSLVFEMVDTHASEFDDPVCEPEAFKAFQEVDANIPRRMAERSDCERIDGKCTMQEFYSYFVDQAATE